MPLPMSGPQAQAQNFGNTPPTGTTPANETAILAALPQRGEYADELYGSFDEVTKGHYDEEGEEALKLFCQALYGSSRDPRDYHNMATTFAFIGLRIPPPDLVRYMEYLVDFVVNKEKSNERIGEFIRGIKNLPEWTFEPREELTRAWSLFWIAISFNPDLPVSSLSFQSRIAELLQLAPPNATRVPKNFNLKTSLLDLERLDIKVRPTLNLDEHMTLEGDTLKVLRLSPLSWNLCLTYHDNLVAKALKIDTLGTEVLGSLYALYGEGTIIKKSVDMELVEIDMEEIEIRMRILKDEHSKGPPRLLASRIFALEKLVAKRRSWWPTLTRDVRLQSSTQPILFYGSILAVISVISSVISAVAAVWNLVVSIKQLHAVQ